MSQVFTEEGYNYEFPDSWEVIKFDETDFYKNAEGSRIFSGVDFLVYDGVTLFLIEIKTSNKDITKISKKYKDTLSLLLAAKTNIKNVKGSNKLNSFYTLMNKIPKKLSISFILILTGLEDKTILHNLSLKINKTLGMFLGTHYVCNINIFTKLNSKITISEI